LPAGGEIRDHSIPKRFKCLARRIYELKKVRHAVKGEFVDVKCATLCGDGAMSACDLPAPVGLISKSGSVARRDRDLLNTLDQAVERCVPRFDTALQVRDRS
jgi:sigma54-dependent transcription regulator